MFMYKNISCLFLYTYIDNILNFMTSYGLYITAQAVLGASSVNSEAIGNGPLTLSCGGLLHSL